MSSKAPELNKRLASLDTLRGFDMLFIMGFSTLIIAVCRLIPGGTDWWIYHQQFHPEWNGLTHHDTIFPLFIFIAGISFPFSFAKQQEKGVPLLKTYWKIIRRALILILFGLICNGLLKFGFADLRYWSVLARIGLAGMLASILYIHFKPAVRVVIAAVLLVGYWLLVGFVTAPDAPPGAGPLTLEGNIVGYVDRCLFPGHLYKGTGGIFDPEGTLSTLPAVVTAMMGMFAGEWVRRKDVSEGRKVLSMAVAAAVLLAVGLVWAQWFPINKKLWTSSFVLVTGAYSLALFALFYWIVDVRGWRKWILPFTVIGMNSITVFMAPRVIDFKFATNFFLEGLCGLMDPLWAKVVWQCGYLALVWLFLYFLYKKKIFLKV